MGENISTRVAYGKALAEFGTDEKLFVFDADLKKCTMTLYFAEKYPERFFNIGIAEANMVDIAADLRHVAQQRWYILLQYLQQDVPMIRFVIVYVIRD